MAVFCPFIGRVARYTPSSRPKNASKIKANLEFQKSSDDFYVCGLGMSPLGFLGGLSGKGTFHDACSTVESHVDVRADMVFAEQLTETVVLQHAVEIADEYKNRNLMTLTEDEDAQLKAALDEAYSKIK